MAADIGARIGIDGEKTFRDSLKAMNAQIRSLNDEMKAVTSSFEGMENSEEAVAARSEVLQRTLDANRQKLNLLNNQADRAKERLNQLGEELDRATREFGENSEEAIRAQNAYNRQARAVSSLESQISGTTADINRMEREMRDLGESANDTANDIEKAGKDIGGFGDSLKSAFTFGAVSGAVQSLAGSITGLIDSTTEYRKIMGTLEVSSQRAGYSAEETAETYRTLYGVLGDEQTAATAAANLQAVGLEQDQLTEITQAAIGAWATYGDSIPIDGLAESINETIQAGAVTGNFADVLNWAGTNEEEFNKKLEAASDKTERANIVLQELANQGLTEAGEAWQENNKSLVDANNATGDMTATLASFAEMLSPIVTEVKNGINGVLQAVLGLINIGQEGGLSAVFDQIVQWMIIAAQGIAENLPLFMEQAAQIIPSFINGIITRLPDIVFAGQDILSAIISGLTEALPNLITSAGDILTNFFNTLKENTPAIMEKGKEILESLVKGVIDSIPALLDELPKVIDSFVDFIGSALPDILETGTELLLSLINGIIDAIPDLVAKIPEIIQSITSTITENLPQIIDSGFEILQNLIDGIIDAIPRLVENIPQILNALEEGLRAGIDAIIDVGEDLIEGLWEGLWEGIKSIGTKIKGIGDTVINGLKDALGIDSPSRVARDEVGKMVGLGLAEGLDLSAPDAADAAIDMADGVVKGMNEAIPQTKKTAQKIGDVLEREINAVNASIEKMQAKETQEQAEKELAEYKQSIQEKYKELEKAEVEKRQDILDEIAKLENDWNEKQIEKEKNAAKTAAQEALQERLSALEKFQQEYESAMGEIESKESSLADKLKDYGTLFEWVETEEDGKLFQLGDLQEEINEIEKYAEALSKLQDRGISDSLMGEITSLGIEDAMDYMDSLISMSDKEFDQYIALFEQKQKVAQEAAQKVYQSEFDALEEQYLQKIPQSVYELQDQMFTAGANAAEQLSKGFQSQGTVMGDTVELSIQNAVESSQEETSEETFQTMIQSMTEQEPLLSEYLTALKDRLIALVQGFYGEFREVGQLLMEGIAEGIEDGKSGVINAIADALKEAVSAAREEMDIHSPSGVFAEIGGYMAEGLGQGWIKKMKAVTRSITGNMQTVLPTAAPVMAGNADYRRNYTYGDIHLYIDKVNNGNGRTIETLARELEFLRRQQTAAKGGDRS